MITLNYNDLSKETQEQLLKKSKKDVARKYGNALLRYSRENRIAYEALLEEEAIRNLYNYKYSFRV